MLSNSVCFPLEISTPNIEYELDRYETSIVDSIRDINVSELSLSMFYTTDDITNDAQIFSRIAIMEYPGLVYSILRNLNMLNMLIEMRGGSIITHQTFHTFLRSVNGQLITLNNYSQLISSPHHFPFVVFNELERIFIDEILYRVDPENVHYSYQDY